MSSESGFTLIELITVIGIISVLSALGMSSFDYYKSAAGYATAEQTLHDARNAIEASLVDQDALPNSVPLTVQRSKGPISNATAADFLPGMMLPPSVKFQVTYDNACNTSDCQSEFVQVNHCSGQEYVSWTRYGDGVEVRLDHISGAGCS